MVGEAVVGEAVVGLEVVGEAVVGVAVAGEVVGVAVAGEVVGAAVTTTVVTKLVLPPLNWFNSLNTSVSVCVVTPSKYAALTTSPITALTNCSNVPIPPWAANAALSTSRFPRTFAMIRTTWEVETVPSGLVWV